MSVNIHSVVAAQGDKKQARGGTSDSDKHLSNAVQMLPIAPVAVEQTRWLGAGVHHMFLLIMYTLSF